MDSRVLQTQKWLNTTYGKINGFPSVDEDGITGNSTFRALIYALQLEIGIENPDGVFGNNTLSKCPTLRESANPYEETPSNLIYILQGSLWCKGISPGGFTGILGPATANAIYIFQVSAGVNRDKIVYPYILQGIMNTDSYTFRTTNNIYDTYRHQVQMGLNQYYGSRIGLVAPNGIWERKSHKNLIKAIQLEWAQLLMAPLDMVHYSLVTEYHHMYYQHPWLFPFHHLSQPYCHDTFCLLDIIPNTYFSLL